MTSQCSLTVGGVVASTRVAAHESQQHAGTAGSSPSRQRHATVQACSSGHMQSHRQTVPRKIYCVLIRAGPAALLLSLAHSHQLRLLLCSPLPCSLQPLALATRHTGRARCSMQCPAPHAAHHSYLASALASHHLLTSHVQNTSDSCPISPSGHVVVRSGGHVGLGHHAVLGQVGLQHGLGDGALAVAARHLLAVLEQDEGGQAVHLQGAGVAGSRREA